MAAAAVTVAAVAETPSTAPAVAEETAVPIEEPKADREARADPPAATAMIGIARSEVAATAGPVTQRMGQVVDHAL